MIFEQPPICRCGALDAYDHSQECRREFGRWKAAYRQGLKEQLAQATAENASLRQFCSALASDLAKRLSAANPTTETEKTIEFMKQVSEGLSAGKLFDDLSKPANTCDRHNCKNPLYVQMSWLAGSERQQTSLCQDHAKELSEQLRKFPGYETLICEKVL